MRTVGEDGDTMDNSRLLQIAHAIVEQCAACGPWEVIELEAEVIKVTRADGAAVMIYEHMYGRVIVRMLTEMIGKTFASVASPWLVARVVDRIMLPKYLAEYERAVKQLCVRRPWSTMV